MAQFLIESPHTQDECLRALDELLEEGPEVLDRFEFACRAGDHRGWATVEANSLEQAREVVPGFLRGKARVVPVEKITPAQIRAYHKH
jgi:hypothetical protein